MVEQASKFQSKISFFHRTDESASGENEHQNANIFRVNRIYLKDLSLEQPNSQRFFVDSVTPEVGVELKTYSDRLADRIYESVLTATVKATVEDQVLFLIEGSQAALIELFINKDAEIVLNVDVPNLLLPYLRVNLADLISRSGFPPIHLANVNFYELYKNYVAEKGRKNP